MRRVGKVFFSKGSDKKMRWKGGRNPLIHRRGGGFGKKMECLINAKPFKRPLSI